MIGNGTSHPSRVPRDGANAATMQIWGTKLCMNDIHMVKQWRRIVFRHYMRPHDRRILLSIW